MAQQVMASEPQMGFNVKDSEAGKAFVARQKAFYALDKDSQVLLIKMELAKKGYRDENVEVVYGKNLTTLKPYIAVVCDGTTVYDLDDADAMPDKGNDTNNPQGVE